MDHPYSVALTTAYQLLGANSGKGSLPQCHACKLSRAIWLNHCGKQSAELAWSIRALLVLLLLSNIAEEKEK